MELAYYCMDNPRHMFKGDNLDGIRCPWCKGLLNIKPVTEEQYKALPTYDSIRKPINKVKDLKVNLAFDDKTILKLRAIANHAEALANELDAIDAAEDDLPTRLEGSD